MMHRILPLLMGMALTFGTGACAPGVESPLSDPQEAGAADYIQGELDAFRTGLPPVDTLSHASDSREALVERFVRALQAADTAAFALMAMSRQEFAWMYYPHTRYVARPYELPADVVWFNLQNRSSRGLSRVLARYSGVSLPGIEYTCPDEPEVEGPNTFWHGCVLWREIAPGDTVRERAFGSIWEREGRFKIVSFTNQY